MTDCANPPSESIDFAEMLTPVNFQGFELSDSLEVNYLVRVKLRFWPAFSYRPQGITVLTEPLPVLG